jgi:hypothetical protein
MRSGTSGNTAGTTVSDTASCPGGSVLLGGGARLTSASGTYAQSLGRVAIVESYASGPTTWTASMVVTQNFAAASSATITAYAVCSA